MPVGIKIKDLRKAKGLSRNMLAKELDITYHALSKYENNERQPDYSTLIKIADYFEVSIDYLLGRTNIKDFGPCPIVEDLPQEAQQVIEDFKEYLIHKYGKNK